MPRRARGCVEPLYKTAFRVQSCRHLCLAIAEWLAIVIAELSLWRAMELCRDEGLLPSADYKNQAELFEHSFHENTPFVWPRSLPDGWQETARSIRVLEWAAINSTEEYVSALLNGCPVIIGRDGHSMVAEDLVIDRGNYFARICDSYGANSRDGTGRIYDSERKMARSTGGAWACLTVTRPDNLWNLNE